jgi:hypothetical protein
MGYSICIIEDELECKRDTNEKLQEMDIFLGIGTRAEFK